ncbi:hypothetical protein [Morganella morganii]|uniref:hypothetical protein n=1 Tax=Morganella morganii TaxID=582 RepID=UPI001BDA378F|nr:hypothetical protein [Morganella morganii]ELT0452294.1 hypothetical protein [Morganella morganii]MBT0335449.1 hypothetical protein [Morganella morganii subsp. morganii]
MRGLFVPLLLLPVILTGCAYNTTLSPPADSRNIHFSATVPADLESLPLSAMYRSKKCTRTRTRTSGSGKSYEVPGFNSTKYPLSVTASGDVTADIPVNGGGYCDWQLSNIKFEVRMKEPQIIESGISDNFGFKTVFITDNNAPQAFNGGYTSHKGDFNESLLLFPFISEYFLGGHKKTIEVIGESDMLTYRLSGTNNIHLMVVYDKMMSKKKKKETEQLSLILMAKKNENPKAILTIKNY